MLFFQWLRTVVIGWLRQIYGETEASSEVIKTFEQKLTHSLYQAYTKTRIEQLFNIIIGEWNKVENKNTTCVLGPEIKSRSEIVSIMECLPTKS